MKVTELKVGDWVVCNSEPLRIAEIDIFLCSAWDKNEYFHGGITIDYLTPIPLTSEILEKNGWKAGNEIWGIDYVNYIKSRLHIALFSKSKDMIAMVSPIDDSDMCVCLRQIKFVHELQHLLWALGMDDDLKI